MNKYLSVGVALVALGSSAHAGVIVSANLAAQLAPSEAFMTVVALDGLLSQSQGQIIGKGYSITFDTDVNQGLVQGMDPTRHATPVAGSSDLNQVSYLLGDYGSGQTTNASDAGKYLSTGYGRITLTFQVPQTSLAFLWGSIDRENYLTFNDAANDMVSGAQVQALAVGFKENGDQGVGGSAYVLTTTDTPFTSVVLSSGVMSFEAAAFASGSSMPGVQNSTKLAAVAVPEPATLACLGAGLVWLGLMRRRASLRR